MHADSIELLRALGSEMSMLDSSVGEHEEAAICDVSHSVVPPDGRPGFAAHCVSPKVSHSTMTLHVLQKVRISYTL